MITYVTPYYENAGMLAEQLENLSDLPANMRKKIEYIVVDDGSSKSPAIDEVNRTPKPILSDINFQLFQIEKDIPWNHIAARNIGVHHSTNRWLMLTDMDHLVPFQTWERLLKWVKRRELCFNKSFYTFDRVDAPDWRPYKPHPHTWFMNMNVWERFGGYDERFSGHYGMDFLARERLLEFAQMKHLKTPVVRYPREVIPDASTTNYKRKLPEDRAFVKQLRTRLKRQGTYNQPKTLSFLYRKVYP